MKQQKKEELQSPSKPSSSFADIWIFGQLTPYPNVLEKQVQGNVLESHEELEIDLIFNVDVHRLQQFFQIALNQSKSSDVDLIQLKSLLLIGESGIGI
jgi:hypothetical protein